VHSDTFKFLGGLNRTDNKDEQNENFENPETKIQIEKAEKRVIYFFLNN